MKLIALALNGGRAIFRHLSAGWLPGNRAGITFFAYVAFSAVSLLGAFLIRFEGQVPYDDRLILWMTLPLAVVLKVLAAGRFGVMRELPQHVSVEALTRILKAAASSTVVFIIAVILFYGNYGRQFPRSIFIIDFLLTVVVFGGSRFFLHVVLELIPKASRSTKRRNTLVIGAGSTGEMAMQIMNRDFPGVFSVIGFLDDDPTKRGMTLRGHPILGRVDDAPAIIRDHDISEVVIALPATTKERVRDIVEICSSRKVKFRIIPTTRDRISQGFGSMGMRELRIEDLLGRESVELDFSSVYRDIEGRRVLVTGAGGSIGSELVRQLAKCNPAVLLLLDVAETPLFEINQDL